MATAQKFEDLEIWQLARQLENKVYILIKSNNISKDYALITQMNRSSGSVMDNIAEGFGRGSRLEFIQFLTISSGSCDELKSQLYRCKDRLYITESIFVEMYELADKTNRKIKSMINYLNKSNIKGQKFRDRNNDKLQTKNDKQDL